ncbi:MAG TPA: PAS domain S-box protein [Blastocatellia bacterium]|nr:PAS domain S-box protein [Blastocatellia bacterium]
MVGARRPGFPDKADSLLLKVAANQAAIALQGARLLSARRRAEQKLAESEARFRTIVNQANTGVVQADPAGRLTLVNQRWCEMIGYTEAELLRMTIMDVTHPDSLAQTREAISRLAAGGSEFEIEKNYLRRDGSVLRARSCVSALRGSDGEFLGLVAVVLDITERRRAEDQIAGQHRILEALAVGLDLTEILDLTTKTIEGLLPGARASVLLADSAATHLHCGSARSLPEAYNAAIDGIEIGEGVGSCGTAAFRRAPVIVSDIARDPLWQNYRELAATHRLAACWSHPILSPGGRLLGTFATCFSEPRTPDSTELTILESAARVAGIAIHRRQTEEALRYAAAQFATLLNQSPLGVYLVDADFRIREVNPVARPVFGDIPNLIGRDFDEVMHLLWPQEYADEIVRLFRHTLDTGESYFTPERAEFRIDRGVTEYYEWRIDRIPLPDGRNGVVCYFRDISAQVRAREVIRESEERYRGIVNQSIGGIAETDPTGRFTTVNDRYCEITGYSREELLKLRMQEITHPEDLPRNLELFEKLVAGGEPFEIEKRYVRGDGSLVWVHNSVSAIRDTNGKVRSLITVSIDITGRREAEEKIRESEERLRAMFAQAGVGVVLIDSDCTMRQVNPKFCEIVGYDESELLGRSCLEMTHEDDRAENIRVITELFSSDSETVSFEKRYVRREGALVWVRINLTRIVGANGASRQLVAIVEDITGRKQNETLLAEQSRLLELIATNRPLRECLDTLTDSVSRLEPTVRAAVLIASPERSAMADSFSAHLAPSFGQAIQGAPISEVPIGTCGTAIHTGQPVTCPDIANSENWSPEWRALCLAHGIKACHSQPVFGPDGRASAVFLLCLAEARGPSEGERRIAEFGAHIASIVIERDRAAQALQQSEEQFRAFVTASSDVVYRMSADWTEMRFLQGRDFIPDTEDPSRTWLEKYIHPDDQPQVLATIQKAISARSIFELEHRVIRVDGTLGWTFSRAIPLLDAQGEIVEWFGTASDVTRRKEAEEALREAQARRLAEEQRNAVRLRQLNAAAVEINAATSVEEVICLINDKARDLTGARVAAVSLIENSDWTRARTVASRSNEYTTGRDFAAPESLFRLVASEKLTMRLTRAELETHPAWRAFGAESGTHAPLNGWLAAPLCDSRNECFGIVQLSDKWIGDRAGEFTESDEALQQLAQVASVALEKQQLYEQEQAARQVAEQATRAKDEFLAVVSHELRTPLNSILGWTRMLQAQRRDNPGIRKFADTVERSGRAQIQMIEDLLDTARIISGKLRLEVAPVELTEVVTSALDTVRPAAKSRAIALEVEFNAAPGMNADQTPYQITGDFDRLQQVVWNLLSNAIKFTPEGGRVRIALSRQDSAVQIVVSDTGKGISPDLLPYVFDRFRQGDSSASRRFGGLGLGLALVRHLVELHGGEVRVESAGEGRGATFTIRLPVRAVRGGTGETGRGETVTVAGHSTSSAAPRLDGLRILVVDDDEAVCALIALTLRQFGALMTTAGSAAAALSALEAPPEGAPFDVLVSDIGMPGEDGYELIERVRAHPDRRISGVRAIALTAYARAEDRLKALQAGYQMHVTKPVDEAELTIVIASLTGRIEPLWSKMSENILKQQAVLQGLRASFGSAKRLFGIVGVQPGRSGS